MPRFLTLTDVAETLQISMSQTRSLVRSGELPAIQVGGRGQWRVDQRRFDEYIERLHEEQEIKTRERAAQQASAAKQDQNSGT